MKTQAQAILQVLHSKFKISDEQIACKFGVKSITVYRWRLGKFNPSAVELKLLKRICTGHIASHKAKTIKGERIR